MGGGGAYKANLLPNSSQLGTNLPIIFNGLYSTEVEGAPVTRPVGVLDPAPPKGCSCVESKTKSFRFPKPQDPSGAYLRVSYLLQLGPTWLYLGATWLSCPPSSSILSNMAPSWLQLGSSLLLLGPTYRQLGPTWSHLGSTWLQFWSQLGPTWSQNLTKMSFKRCLLTSPSDLYFLFLKFDSMWVHFSRCLEGGNSLKL